MKVRDDLISMITAGHETTAGQLGWALQLLAHHPHVQDRLTDEIDAGAGDEYLTATISETLRVRPVFVFTIPRAVVSSVEIGGRVYRSPAHLAACTYLMHRNPSVEFAHAVRPYVSPPERPVHAAQAACTPPPCQLASAISVASLTPWPVTTQRCPSRIHVTTLAPSSLRKR